MKIDYPLNQRCQHLEDVIDLVGHLEGRIDSDINWDEVHSFYMNPDTDGLLIGGSMGNSQDTWYWLKCNGYSFYTDYEVDTSASAPSWSRHSW